MSEFLQHSYYENTVSEWFIAMGTVLAIVILGKFIYRIVTNIIRRMTAKTKSRLDDILIDMVEEPAFAAMILSGVWFSLNGLNMTDDFRAQFGHIMQFTIIMMIAWMLSRLLNALFEEYLVPAAEKTENDMDDQLLPILRKGTKIIIWSMAVIIGLNNAGYDVAALIAGLGIGGLAMAMAAKDTVANIFGGFTIFTDKPFTINDRVKVSGFDGTVVEIGVRSTRIKTLEGRIVTIPNSKFADSAVENVSLEPSRKVSLDLGLTYDTTPEKMELAISILQKIVASEEGISQEPVIFFSGFGDFAMNIKFIYYITKGANIALVQNQINLQILREFNSEGLEFAFPTQTLYNIQSSK